MNFTKEYIERCKCKEIQELRPIIEKGDWFKLIRNDDKLNPSRIHYGAKCPTRYFGKCRENIIWLPLSHQLDEEIVKICKEKKFAYTSIYSCDWGNYQVWVGQDFYDVQLTEEEENPLIAKIKLLIQLKGMK